MPQHQKQAICSKSHVSDGGRPRRDHHRRRYFDGKIGIWPFAEQVPAKRISQNLPKGTLITRPSNVSKDVYREYLMRKVFPAICARILQDHRAIIHVQQDNPRAHVSREDNDVVVPDRKK